jgi:hypothetical protein
MKDSETVERNCGILLHARTRCQRPVIEAKTIFPGIGERIEAISDVTPSSAMMEKIYAFAHTEGIGLNECEKGTNSTPMRQWFLSGCLVSMIPASRMSSG